MTEIAMDIMTKLYGHNIWQGFLPLAPSGHVQGWNGDHPALRRIAAGKDQTIIIDVGVWKGQSTINMALAMKEKGIDGCVISVDTFLGSIEHWSVEKSLFDRTFAMPNLYNQFMANVYHAGVSEYVIPMPQTSVNAASILRNFDIRPSIVHVDASHEYDEVLRDIQNFWKILLPGGVLIGDDYHVTWPGVVQAAGEFSALTKVPLEIEVPKWIMRKRG